VVPADEPVEVHSTPRAVARPDDEPSPPVRIRIPDLQIDAQVVRFGWSERVVDGVTIREWRQEDIAGGVAGHLANSARPGEGDNVVIAGHSNIEGRVFKNLSAAWDESSAEFVEDGAYYRSSSLEGVSIYLHDARGRVFAYKVESMYKVAEAGVSEEQKQSNARFMRTTWRPTLTVITCWPPHSNTHRVIVVARPQA
jgi:hypothetical protein